MKKFFLVFLSLFIFLSCSKNPSVEKEDLWENIIVKQKTIIALGDSLTAWYWVELSENYPTKEFLFI